MSCLIVVPAVGSDSHYYEDALRRHANGEHYEAYILLKNALSSDPNHLPSKLLMGKVLLANGYVLESVEELEEVLAQGADEELVAATLLQAYLLSGQYDKVQAFNIDQVAPKLRSDLLTFKAQASEALDLETTESHYQAAIELAPESTRVLNSYAAYLLQQGRASEAKAFIERSAELAPNNSRTLHIQGVLATQNDNLLEAEKWFDRALNSDPDDPIVLRSLALTYARLNRYEEALPLVEKLIAKSPNDPLVLLLKARILKADGQFEAAKLIIDEAANQLSLIVTNEENGKARVNLLKGTTSFLNENYLDGTVQLEKYLQVIKDDENAIGLLAQTYLASDQTRKAKRLLENNYALVKKQPALVLSLCNIYFDSSAFIFCETLLNELDDKVFNDITIRNLRVELLRRQGKTDEALKLFKQLFQAPLSVGQSITLIRLMVDNDDSEGALLLSSRLIEVAPSNGDLRLLRAEILIAMRQLEKAKEDVSELVKLSPNAFLTRRLEAKYAIEIGDFERAETLLDDLIDENPSNQAINLMYASVLDKLNRQTDAIALLETYQRKHYDTLMIKEALVDLYIRVDNYTSAIKELDALRAIRVDQAKYVEQKINILIKTKDYSAAKAEISRLTDMLPRDSQTLTKLVDLNRRSGDIEGSLKLIQSARQQSLLNSTLKLEEVRLLLMKGQLKLAEKRVNEVLNTEIENPVALYLAARVQMQNNDLPAAFNYYKTGFESGNNPVLFATGLYQLTLNNYGGERFEKMLTSATDLPRATQAQLNYLLAMHMVNQERLYEAQSLLVSYIDSGLNANRQWALVELAKLIRDTDPQKALSYTQEAIKLAPQSSRVIAAHAWSYTSLKDFNQGLYFARQAHTLDAKDGQIVYLLGYLLASVGRCNEAVDELKSAIQLGNSSSEYVQAESLLSKLTEEGCR